ncbi:relaxase/mobilization nuclease domain-containing protein [Leisingera caerulea]|uniref:Relaxase/mobilization nuclease domain-containing protein n=1 Tax=Leisingera caerulea TaxID=506591 RepID=A0A9Q9M3W1_LEICA|nr:relaxase/mobilization nuclease domain-containing protein [Leisingera caerulea]UWQ54998.1 relaxase/mobilization nuclease domain-containing protein [Leisingera caerulea]
MIAKIGKGNDFGRLLRYLTRDERGEVLDMRHLASTKPREAAREMQVAAAVSIRCRKPVMHISISYDPSDKPPSDDDMRADAAEVLAALGLADNQALVIKHSDRNHRHFHIAANRVGSDGKAVIDSQSYPKTEAALRRVEARRGLSATPGRHAPSPTTGTRMSGGRRAINPHQHSAPESVRQALLTAKSWDGLHKELAHNGWQIENVQKGKRPAGAILIGPDGQRIAAGKIDRGATLSKLRARLGSEKTKSTANPISARTTSKKPLALAKPSGAIDWKKKRKSNPEQRLKDIAQIGAETAIQLVGTVSKAATPRGGLIGTNRKASTPTRKRKRPSARLGL